MFVHIELFPLVQYVVLIDIHTPISNEIIHNVSHPKTKVKYNSPLLIFGYKDMVDDFESSYTSGF